MGHLRLPFIFTLAVGLLSCTRQPVSSSHIHLNVAQANANQKVFSHSGAHALDDTPSLLVVNITGAGINSPILYSWSDGCDAQSCGSFPTDISLNVPRGSNRLIQVLVVYNEGRKFSYGDMVHDVAAATESVTINVTSSGENVEQAHVMGRYLDGSANGGPSGVLLGNFAPPNGSPLMLVTQIPIFAGWFSLVAFTSSSLTYTFNGNPIFPKLNLASVALNPSAATQNIVRIHAPAYLRLGQTVAEDTQTFVMGYFGSTSSQKACYNDGSSTISGATQPDGTTPLAYSGTFALSSYGTTVMHIAGGTANSTDATCSSGTSTLLFNARLNFNEQALRNGHDSVAGFKGPWQLNSGLTIVDVNTASGAFNLSWNFLPGVTTGDAGIRGVTAFARSLSLTSDYNADNGVACSRIGDLGFSPIGSEIATQAGQNLYTLPIPLSPYASKVVLCPFSVVNGLRLYPDAGAEVVTSVAPPVATLRFNAVPTGMDSPSTIFGSASHTQAPSTCKTYQLQLMNSGTTPNTVPIPTTIAISPSEHLYPVSGCGGVGTVVTSITMASGSSAAALYLQSTSSGSNNLDILGFSATVNSGLISGSAYIQTAGTSSSTAMATSANLLPTQSLALSTNGCYPVLFSLSKTVGGDPSYFASALTALTFSGVNASSFFTTPDCSTTVFSGGWPANETTLLLYMKPPTGVTALGVTGGTATTYSPLNFSAN